MEITTPVQESQYRKNGEDISCSYCNKKFYRSKLRMNKNKWGNFCSSSCWGKWHSQNITGEQASNFKGARKEKACLVCGKSFKTYINSRFCSRQCSGISQRKRIILKCDFCHKEFTKTESYERVAIKRGHTHNFCSNNCKYKFNTGSNSVNWVKDRSKVKSEIRCLRYSSQMMQWREFVFNRDNFTCQTCGLRGGYIQAHHINMFAEHPDLRFDPSNGITLCKKCHKSIRGKEEQFVELFHELIGKDLS
jgi:5-methylcytosine-specific restriction endonuclease McrA